MHDEEVYDPVGQGRATSAAVSSKVGYSKREDAGGPNRLDRTDGCDPLRPPLLTARLARYGDTLTGGGPQPVPKVVSVPDGRCRVLVRRVGR